MTWSRSPSVAQATVRPLRPCRATSRLLLAMPFIEDHPASVAVLQRVGGLEIRGG
jgi:hypothetical protein